jgi:alpha-glucosidase
MILEVSVMQKLIIFVILLLYQFCIQTKASASLATSYDLSSPNGHIQIKIQAGERITYDIVVNSKTVIRNATLSLDIDHANLGANPKVNGTKNDSVARDIQCPVPQKSAKIHEAYTEVRLEMAGNYAVVFRAYNEGVAYRFETTLPQNAVKVYNEDVSLNFAGDYNVYYPKEESFFSHNEREFLYFALKDIPATSIASLPRSRRYQGWIKLIIGESDVDDYPGLWLHGNSNNSLSGTFLITRSKKMHVTIATSV